MEVSHRGLLQYESLGHKSNLEKFICLLVLGQSSPWLKPMETRECILREYECHKEPFNVISWKHMASQVGTSLGCEPRGFSRTWLRPSNLLDRRSKEIGRGAPVGDPF